MEFFAPAARGLEYLLVDEILDLGAEEATAALAGVRFTGTLETAYRACLWSRLASRVLLPIETFEATDSDSLYAGVHAIDWSDHLVEGSTLAVRSSVTNSAISHSHFAALRVKDAVVDQCRERHGWRPSVDTEQPDLLIDLYVRRNEATISIDLAGRSLHLRGYRIAAGPAPLKETLAAAVLMRGDWPKIAAAGGGLLDPMCGSGTFLIEAAMMAVDQAPGLAHPSFALQRWAQFDAAVWDPILAEARDRWSVGRERLKTIDMVGADESGRAVHASRQNIVRANFSGPVKLFKEPIENLKKYGESKHGLVVCNPPYGERVEHDNLPALYRTLGQKLGEHYLGWRAALLVADDGLSRATGLRADKRYQVYNGPLECRVITADISAPRETLQRRPLGKDALMVRNRLAKNLKHIRKRLSREAITSYRLYDADLPEYSAAVDVYNDYAHVQEYAPPKSIPTSKAQRRFADVCQSVGEVLELPPEKVITKQRQRQSGTSQYEKISGAEVEFVIEEAGLQFLVNLTSYLDTGLFLDHRNTRAMIRDDIQGQRFLNLFAYTGAVSIYAAAGGAKSTTSVDLSNTYCRWARKNFTLNGFNDRDQHEIIGADCMGWLADCQGEYDVIFVDPPTWSNSKSTEADFSVQDDHARLLELAWNRLAPGGRLWFSTNFKKFKLGDNAAAMGEYKEMTSRTVPFDFERRRPHRSWRWVKPSSG